ncbi:MAG TPA: hypothetical protein VFR03_17430 [Thermoanaerobaculia bacterium]|nr:hypothetical protein [Thermoanaerobaculia bacterium]
MKVLAPPASLDASQVEALGRKGEPGLREEARERLEEAVKPG